MIDIEKLKKSWNKLDTDSKISILRPMIILASILVFVIIVLFNIMINPGINTDNTDDTLESQIDTEYPQLSIRYVEEDRHLDNIHTFRFQIYNTETEEACSLSDGILPMDDISNKMEEFLKSHPYKVCSVGIVDNMFYIQQDLNQVIEKNMDVNIVSLSNSFGSEDWLSLTEATYKNADVMADNIFTYTGAQESKHYIYIHAVDNTNEDAMESNSNNAVENNQDMQLDINGNIILDS